MKLISAQSFLLLLSSNGFACGSNIRGSRPENDADVSITSTRRLGMNGIAVNGNKPNSVQGQPWTEETYDCDEGCEVGGGSPVCGVDGNTFFNECFAVCQGIEVQRKGACPQDPLGDMASYARGGKVTKEELHAFKAEKFKLVAKRNPMFGMPDEDEEPIGDGRGSDGLGVQRSAKVSRMTSEGLEYVAEYDMDDIPEGHEYDASKGELPEPTHGDSNRLLSVLGRDTRFEESAYNWPNWRLVQTDLRRSDGSYRNWCSGAIIGPSKVLTAAHFVYGSTWIRNARVAPGRYGGNRDPWGQWNIRYTTIYTAWTRGDWEFDIAVLTIADSGSYFNRQIGDYMGYLGMRTQPCSYREADWRITGYPGDKPRGTVWNAGICDDWSYSCGSRKIYHQCDTAGGMSGSAIRDGGNYIVGVHTNGAGSGSFNSGVAITNYHLANIQNW
mmetsp:Transcript_7878/g.17084  ORF Transcript_7878/g.17084 Transcript_7878/m.17084 type:complete len:442 (+) Transcript_7878:1014-2339(+)